MPRLKLTDLAVKRLTAARGKRIEYFDALTPGFALRVSGPTDGTPAGGKSWIVFYRVGRRLRRHTIGGYPAFSLAEAREAARIALKAAARGDDPAAAKRAEAMRQPDTVANVVEIFLKRHMEGKGRTTSYTAATRRTFENHVLPRWRSRDIRKITRRDVIELLDAIVDKGAPTTSPSGPTKRTRKRQVGGPIAANRTLAAIRKLFNWALQRGLIDATPVALVENPGEEQRRERALSADEIKELWPRFDALGYPVGPFFKMVLVTGQRRSEVSGMRWAGINEAERTWTLASEDTKAGRAHIVPLSQPALEILAECRLGIEKQQKARRKIEGEMPPEGLGAYVFTTMGDRPISGYGKAKARIDKAVRKARKKAIKAERPESAAAPDDLEPWTIHDLRRTVATGLGRLGISRLVIARVLNHADRTVTGIYDRHEYLAEKRHALEAWGQYVQALMSSPEAGARDASEREPE